MTGEQHQVPIEPGQLDWVTAMVRGELDTFRNARPDGTGLAGGHGGAALLDEPPADDGSRP